MYSVDIDVGGTLTDGIFSNGQRIVCAKVDTTAHDLTVCLFDCLQQGATQLGFEDLSAFLEHVELLRWSTTITSNVLAEGRGPKIGLIVSKGHERDLYGAQAESPALSRVIDEKNIVGIEHSGSEILSAVRSLLESGVRRICISLQGALQNPNQELDIKKAIQEQYPDHFLGSVPALTGSEICQNTDDMTRTHYALVNAYTHSALAATLFKAEDELRYTYGYSRAFLISHINGGVAGISKTRAIDTIESGPILGLYGACYLATRYGVERVIALDVGGTTAKIGIVEKGGPVYSRTSELFGIPVHTSLPYLRSIALGGGSVATVTEASTQLGPESMGSFPGPACYALGGDRPTLTDAFVTAGLINPDYFLGGTKPLDLQAAAVAIEKQVSNPLGISKDDACSAIIDRAYDMVADMITDASRELDRDLSDHVLFAYGGNGGLFACGVSERAHLQGVFLFELGPLFGAFGSSVTDISHVYERTLYLDIGNEKGIERLNRSIGEMRRMGARDLRGEAISAEDATYTVELELSRSGGDNLTLRSSQLRLMDVDFLHEFSSDLYASGATLELVRLRVRKAIARPVLTTSRVEVRRVDSAYIGTRKLIYGSSEARVYKWELLPAGVEVEGCAIIESASSTYLVPGGWVLKTDQYGNARLSNVATRSPQEVQTHARPERAANSRHRVS